MSKLNLIPCLVFIIITSCKSKNSEVFQNRRDNIINIGDKIVDIKSDLIFGNSTLHIVDEFFIINEVSPKGEQSIHLFNKNTFEYVTSTGIIGRGPGEISSPGVIGVDKISKILWVPDHGNKVMWKFPLDSILNNKYFKPTIKFALNYESFIEKFDFLNDSVLLGVAVQIHSDYSFSKEMSKYNLKNNSIKRYGYQHPEATGKKSSSQFALSLDNNFYVNSYFNLDLITICDLEGNLKYNIYGPDGLNNGGNKKSYYFGIDIFNDNIIASYIGDVGVIDGINGPRGNIPSKFLVFDLKGNYQKTIDTGHKFTYFCVDEENKRVIIYFDDRPIPLGYFNL